VRFAKVNVDDNPQTAQALGASSIPTLVVYKDGRLVDRMVGMQSKAELKTRLTRVV
jgi:thioredoxin 1